MPRFLCNTTTSFMDTGAARSAWGRAGLRSLGQLPSPPMHSESSSEGTPRRTPGPRPFPPPSGRPYTTGYATVLKRISQPVAWWSLEDGQLYHPSSLPCLTGQVKAKAPSPPQIRRASQAASNTYTNIYTKLRNNSYRYSMDQAQTPFTSGD